MLGTTLGSYVIQRELGRGGMGAVYVGEHRLLKRAAAIKVLLPKYSQDQDIVQRFFNEARAATAIKHPGIVEIYDFGYAEEANHCAYIVMELCEGESLTARIRTQRDMTVAAALTIVRHIAGTLAAAHEAGIVHRDLKPDNVFVVPDPDVEGGERIKLLDFGIAKLATEASGPSVTNTGVIMGTPNYMSPEQCRGAGGIDRRSDLYSLGCILFELVCGCVPFKGAGAGDIIGAHLLTAPPRPSSLAPDVPANVEALILALLAKQPADRPESADAVIAMILRITGSLSPQLKPGRVAHSSGVAATQRSSDALVDPGAMTAPATDPVGETAPDSAPPRRTSKVAPPTIEEPHPTTLRQATGEVSQPPRGRRGLALGAGVGAIAIVGVAVFALTRDRDAATPPAIDAAVAGDTTTPRIVIGTVAGNGMTDSLRERIRPKLAELVTKRTGIAAVLAPSRDDDTAGRAGHALAISGVLDAEIATDAVKCKFRVLATRFPADVVVAQLTGGATVRMTGRTIQEYELAAADCAYAVFEDLTAKHIGTKVRELLDPKAPPPQPGPVGELDAEGDKLRREAELIRKLPDGPEKERALARITNVIEAHDGNVAARDQRIAKVTELVAARKCGEAKKLASGIPAAVAIAGTCEDTAGTQADPKLDVIAGQAKAATVTNPKRARELYEQLVAAGRRADGLYGIANVEYQRKNYTEADAFANRSLEAEARHDTLLLRARIRLAAGAREAAIKDYQTLLRLDPDNAQAARELAAATRKD